MQHGDVWRALDAIAQRRGLSASGLAKLAGLDATAFNKSKRISKEGRPRWPSTESIARALKATGIDYAEFASLVSGRAKQSIPSLDFPEAVRDHLFNEHGAPSDKAWDKVEFPGPELDDGCFALEIVDLAFEPVYRAGDRIIATRQTDIRRNDRVIVKTRSRALLVGEILRQSSQRLELRALVGRDPVVPLEADDVEWVARIIWASQ